MNKEYYECAKGLGRRGGIWKFMAVLLFLALAAMTVTAFMLKLKNNQYRDILIAESEKFPNTEEQEKELAEIRKRSWSRAHSMANRKSCEERLEDNRITEEA